MCRGTLDASQLVKFVDRVTTAADMTHQLPEAHKLRFVLEVIKMFYTLFKAARNSGEPCSTMALIVNGGRLGAITMQIVAMFSQN